MQIGTETKERLSRTELRLAFTMSGGVSLAVWMGGVTHEFHRLLRSDRRYATTAGAGDQTYRQLLDLLEYDVRADVIAGTSAGGLNGAALAFAIANNLPSLDGAREMWTDLGSLADLLRPANDRAAPSLLQGDDYFYPQLRQAFEKLLRERLSPPQDHNPVELMMGTTVLAGHLERYPDDYGTELVEQEHFGLFKFHYRPGGRGGHGEGGLLVTGDESDLPARLAIAGRSSSSFPAAFEPSFVPIDRSDQSKRRPDMAKVVDFNGHGSRFVIDGGLLANRPIGPTIDAIAAQPADRDVRRVLALVQPDPGQRTPPEADEPEKVPGLGPTVVGILGALSGQSIAGELRELAGHNRSTRARRGVRDLLLANAATMQPGLVELARSLYPAYAELRARASVERSLRSLTADSGEQGALPAELTAEAVTDALLEPRRALLPHAFGAMPFATDPRPWEWGIRTVERSATIVLAYTARAMREVSRDLARAARRGEEVDWRPAQLLGAAKRSLHGVLADLRQIDLSDADFWRRQRDPLAVAGREGLEEWAAGVYDQWGGEQQRGILIELRRLMHSIPRRATAACAAYRLWDGPRDRDLMRILEWLGTPPVERQVERLLALEVIETIGGYASAEQPVELIQISARTPDAFRREDEPAAKLTGIQLHHFGAFYRSSWRANDYMWGRLDGAGRVVQILLRPSRLRELGYTPSEVLAAMDTIVAGCPDGEIEGFGQWVRDRWAGGYRDAVEGELSFLEQDVPAPARLPHATQVLLEILQLPILREDLRNVALKLLEDEVEGSRLSPAAVSFLDRMREAADDGYPPHLLIAAFLACQVGAERLTDEVGTDLLTRTGAQAGGVGLGVVGASDLPGLGVVGRALQGAFLGLHWLARAAIGGRGRSKTFRALSVLLFVAAAGLFAAAIVGSDPNLVLAGFGLIVALVAVAVVVLGVLDARARGDRWPLFAVGVLIVLAVVLSVAPFLARRIYIAAAGEPAPTEVLFEGETRPLSGDDIARVLQTRVADPAGVDVRVDFGDDVPGWVDWVQGHATWIAAGIVFAATLAIGRAATMRRGAWRFWVRWRKGVESAVGGGAGS